MKVTVEREFGGRKLSLTTGEMAKQAAGSVLVQFGETVVFVAAQNGPAKPGQDFFPLTVDYRERSAAAGKFPGGFLKREGRPTLKEVLTARLTDRPIRPLFPEGYIEEIQVMSNVLACDGENDPDVLSIIGASAALGLAPVPFQGPIAAVRVGRINDELVLAGVLGDEPQAELVILEPAPAQVAHRLALFQRLLDQQVGGRFRETQAHPVRRVEAPSGRLHLALHPSQQAAAQALTQAQQRLPAGRVDSLVQAWSVKNLEPPPTEVLLADSDRALLAAWSAPVVGIVGREPSFAALAADGRPEGLSVDLLKAVLARLGVQPREWLQLQPSEIVGKCSRFSGSSRRNVWLECNTSLLLE